MESTQDPLQAVEALLPMLGGAHQKRIFGTTLARAAEAVVVPGASATDLLCALADIADLLAKQLDQDAKTNLSQQFRKLYAAGSRAAEAETPEQLRDLLPTWNGVTQEVDQVKLELTRAFRKSRQQEFGSLEALGLLLRGFGGRAGEIGKDLQSVGKTAMALALPINPELLKLWKNLQVKRDLLRQELWNLGFGEEQMIFLDDVAHDKATLGSLTVEVLNWLKKHDTTEQFRIMFSDRR